jgi:hypothetical protein
MKKLIGILLFIIILVSGCSNIDLSEVSDEDLERVSDKMVVCEEPYMRVGTSCCLDDNQNKICDSDEKEENSSYIINEKIKIDYEIETEIIEENIFEKFSDSKYSYNKKTYEIEGIFLEFIADEVSLGWEKFDVPELFKSYNVLYSDLTADIEYISENVLESSNNINEIDTEFKKHLTVGTHYFRIAIVLSNGEVLYSNSEYMKVHNEHVEDAEFQRCQSLAIAYNDAKVYVKGSRYEINSKEKCIDEFKDTIVENEDFLCSDTIVRRELTYRESEEDDFEVIETDECPIEIEDFDEVKIIAIGDGDTNSITLGSKTYDISVDDIFSNGIGEVLVDSSSEDYIEIFDKTKIENLYVQILENVVSSRDSVQSYTELAVGNYDFSLSSSDVSEICYENGQSSEEQTSVLAIISGDTFEVKESYCSSGSILTKYSCDDSVDSLEVSCEYGCESGRCLKITDVGCDKDELNSGLLTLGDEESMTLNNSTLFEIIEVGDGMAGIKFDGSTEYIEMCEEVTLGNITLLIHETVQSSREGVKGWMEFSYN